jgi:uncharacterized protein YqhQ
MAARRQIRRRSNAGEIHSGPDQGLFFIGVKRFISRILTSIHVAAGASLAAADKNVGGQAVIEGVMMRSPEKVSTSLRLPDGRIVTKTECFVSLTRKHKILGKPIIRGIISFFEMLALGIKTLNYSAEVAVSGVETVETQPVPTRSGRANLAIATTLIVSLALGVAIFFLLPILITQLLALNKKALGFNLIAGGIRVFIFIGYVWALSQFKDFRRLFEYHGAEHKSIFAFEANLPLSTESTKKFRTFHPRCGTSFILIVAILAIITYSISDTLFATVFRHGPSVLERFATHILFLPLVAGASFELLKLSGKTRNSAFTRILIAPGLWIQRITTREPSDDQIEVALAALRSSIAGTSLDPELA